MKSSGVVLTILAAAVLLVASAHAQFAPMMLKASVPFEFSVGKKSYPAGDYLIQRTGPNTLSLRSAEGQFLAVIQTGPVQSLNQRASSVLRFRTVGGRHVLEQVWQSGTTLGYQLGVPRQRTTAVATQQPGQEKNSADAGSAFAGHK